MSAIDLTLDTSLCQGHGRCTLMSPDVFDLDEQGFAVIVEDNVRADQEAGVRRAADNCPERAITVRVS